MGTDIFTTVLDIVGIEKPTDRTIDGVSILSVLTGEKTEGYLTREQPMFWRTHVSQVDDRVALRIGEWKLVANDVMTKFQLFQIEEDWKEKHDLSLEMVNKTEELKAAMFKVWKGIEEEGPKEWWEGEKTKKMKDATLSY